MPRRVWRSLDGPYVAPRPGDTVDLRGTTRALAVAERKEILLSSYYSGVGSYFGGYSSVTTTPGRPWTFDRAIREAYARVPWVHAAVRVIAVSQSGLRFGVKDKPLPVGEGATEVRDDPLLPLLNVRANPVEFAVQLRKRVSMQWMLSPRGGFIERVPPARGSQKRTVELRLLPPGRTRIVPDKDGNIDHYEVDPVGGIGKPRNVDADKVRWFREEHPSDPFAGLTPLEAAGLSVEMDYFARLFNRQFMANDGRPGGIVAVTSPDGKGEPADEAELDRVERKFGGGPVDAGRLVVLDGTVQYEDVTKSARDMQWKDAGVAARNEIFAVYLVPVSAVDSSDRTFSNAGQEWINYWTLMGVPHGDSFAQLFADDVEGVPFLDYSKVAALEEAKATKRAEWRDEVSEGLRTPLRYALDSGQTVGDQAGDFPDVPATRSLWLPAGKVPVALNDADQGLVEKLAPVGTATQAAPMRAGAAGTDGGPPDASAGDGGGGTDGGPPDGGWPGDAGGGDAQFKAARDTHVRRLQARRAAAGRRLRAVGSSPVHDDEDKEDDRARPVEAALTAALTGIAQRQVAVALARTRGVKARVGTRHWMPKPGDEWSTKELDASAIVDPQQWSDQASDAARTNLAPLAQQQYDETRQQAEDDGGADAAAVLGPVVAGAAALLLAHEVAQLVTWVATSAANHGAELLAVVAEAERADAVRVAAGGQPRGIEPVVEAIQAWAQKVPGWIAQVVPTSVAQALEAGKHAVLTPLGDRVQREWRTKLDDRVRDAHKAAEGQVAKGGEPFVVGGEALRYPRDPLGSPGNVINCRCRTRWRLASSAQTKALAVGQNVVADVLALPVRTSAGRRDDGAVPAVGLESPAPPHGATWLRPGERVAAAGALEGVAGRDHLSEILEAKTRHVRTAAGVDEFHEPIGSPIVGHLDVPHLHPHEPDRAELDNLFTGDFAGFHATVAGVYRKDDGSLGVSGTVERDGEEVGEFRRTFHPDTGHVEHVLLKLDGHVQGLGFATSFNAAAEKQYAAWGYRQIDVEAGDTAGGIVWAKAGFLFDDGRPPESVTDALEYARMQRRYDAWDEVTGGVSHLDMTDEEAKAVLSMIGRARGGSEVTPAEVIDCGEIAQAVMREYGWNGYKPIDGTKAAVGDVMRVAVRGTHPLAGVARRDHVGEILAPRTESKVRRVRTEGGVRRFHEPVGSPIVAHPGLGGLGGRDHAAAVAADAARPHAVPDVHGALANLLANRTIEGVHLHPPSGGPSPHFPGGNDHPSGTEHPDAAKLRDAAIAYNGDSPDWTPQIEAEIRAAQPQARVLMPDASAGTGKSTPGKVVVYRGFETSEGWVDAGEPEVRSIPAVRVQRTGDAARALRTEGRRTGLPFRAYRGQVAEDKRWGDAEDPVAVGGMPSDGATGDMAKAKAELAAAGKDVAGLMAGGMGAEAATKEYARLLHNARFRYRRERLKAEKAAGGKAAAKVAADVATPKEQTLGGIGQQLLDDPEKVDLGKELDAEAGSQPKALYSSGYTYGKGTPGGVEPGQNWYDKLTVDTAEPILVRDLVIGGYNVKYGLAMRRNGLSYLAETTTMPDAGGDAAHKAVHAETVARLEQAAKVYEAFLAGVPPERRGMQRGVAVLRGKNPSDAHWAEKFKQPGFTSAATGGQGGTTFWSGIAPHPGLAAHEYGHNLDSGVHLPGKWLSDSGPVLEGQTSAWGAAVADDAQLRGGLIYAGVRSGPDGTFVETRPDPAHPIRIDPDAKAPTTYGEHNGHEDFAESVRLYLKDRREGKLGYVRPETGQALGVNLRFADLWPERAKVLDAAFGVQSDYEGTEWAKAQRPKATEAITARLHAIHEAEQQQGFVPGSYSVEDVQRQFGLSIRNAVRAYGDAQDQYAKDLATQNEKDALEHVKEQLSGQVNTPEAGQVSELVADLMDGFGIDEGKADEIVAAGVGWQAEQAVAKKQAEAATAAKLAAEAAVQDVLSLADLPKELQTVIRKRRANVKLRAKQKGATAEQAEAIAAQYEAEQIAKEAGKLGLAGNVAKVVKVKVASNVHGQAAGPQLRVQPKVTGASKGAAGWLAKAGAAPAPHAPSAGLYGKPQQAKANIAATLAAALNNEADWESYRAYVNSGASSGHNQSFEYPKSPVPAFADTTAEYRQSALDREVSQRVQMWARTSGDSNPFAVMMQQAVKDELGVPGPIGVNANGDSTQKDVDKRYPHCAAFYRRVVRVMYDDTQRQLAADGIEWIPLYRGMKVSRDSHEWAVESDGHHVPLQPASSFSTAPHVSRRFGGMMIRGLVHRSQILGSARTGFGCLNEKEYAVLAPNEDDAAFQVRFVGSTKGTDIKAAFDRPVRKGGMPFETARAELAKALGGSAPSPSSLYGMLNATPEGQDVSYAGVKLPRAAVIAFLEHYYGGS